MCHPKRRLHGDKKPLVENKSKKKVVKKSVKKVSESQQEKPCDAEYFFLVNEDVLY